MGNPFWKQLTREVVRLIRLALGIVPPKPQPLTLLGTQEWYMASVLRHTIGLPPVAVGDLDKWKVHYTVNGGTDQHKEVPAADLDFQVDFTAGDSVHMTVSGIDKAGNEGPESDPLDFTAQDTFPPPKPGTLGVKNVEQIDLP